MRQVLLGLAAVAIIIVGSTVVALIRKRLCSPMPAGNSDELSRWTWYALFTLILLVAAAHIAIWRMQPPERPYVFGVVSLVLIAWPLTCLFAPKWLVIPLMVLPVFGITLGMHYTGDMGANDYMFAAQPPCYTGIWAIAASAGIVYRRLKKSDDKLHESNKPAA